KDAFGRPEHVDGNYYQAAVFKDGGHTEAAKQLVRFLVADGWLETLPDARRRPAPTAVQEDARPAVLARPARPAPSTVGGAGPEPAARLGPLRPRPGGGGPCRA